MSGPPNTLPAISKPIVIETDGIFGELPTGGIINAGGTSTDTFTVNGKSVVTSNNPNTTVVLGYEHIQAISSDTWTINHNGETLRASITIYDSSNKQVLPDEVEIIDDNNVRITFSSAMIGFALVFLF